MEHEELLRLSTELEMISRSSEEKGVALLIYGVRYKEFSAMACKSLELDPDDLLLHRKAKRLLPEGEQWGAFVLTQHSLHFYPLVNAVPMELVSLEFRLVYMVQEYFYLGKNNAIRIDYYSSKFPLVVVFETEVQRSSILSFIHNKAKVRDKTELLEETTVKWRYGQISNFEYLVFLNNLGNRCVLDFSQYPVFPWVIRNYHGENLNLSEQANFRDLSKPIACLDSTKLSRLKVLVT